MNSNEAEIKQENIKELNPSMNVPQNQDEKIHLVNNCLPSFLVKNKVIDDDYFKNDSNSIDEESNEEKSSDNKKDNSTQDNSNRFLNYSQNNNNNYIYSNNNSNINKSKFIYLVIFYFLKLYI